MQDEERMKMLIRLRKEQREVFEGMLNLVGDADTLHRMYDFKEQQIRALENGEDPDHFGRRAKK
jgi:hypothetical protein